jgi:hypothetical protein
MKKKTLIIAFLESSKDVRVIRQVQALRDHHQVTLAGRGAPMEGVDFIEIDQVPKTFWPLRKINTLLYLMNKQNYKKNKQYDKLYWDTSRKMLLNHLKTKTFDIILANEPETFPMAVAYKKYHPNTKIVFDAHEYYPEQQEIDPNNPEEVFAQAFFDYPCAQYIPRADLLITVSPGLVDAYRRLTGKNAEIVTNAVQYAPGLTPQTTDPNRIKLVYAGNVNPTRRLENYLEMTQELEERFRLDLILITPKHPPHLEYYNRILQQAERYPKVQILPGIPQNQLHAALNAYDLGIYQHMPTTLNDRCSLPNKFFDFVQARIGTLSTPLQDLPTYFSKHGIGLTAPGFEPKDIADTLNALSAQQIQGFKENAHAHAYELSAETQAQHLLRLLENL